MTELDEIRRRYERRRSNRSSSGASVDFYEQKIRHEREQFIRRIIEKRFPDTSALKILEIGAGTGGNVPLFLSLGILSENIYLNELLEERLNILNENFPQMNVVPGDAMEIEESEKFDLIFQFTVFTSILDRDFRSRLSSKMKNLLRKGGSIIWYDFVYNNPGNKDVRKVSRKELTSLFTDCEIDVYSLTLAPPIGRRVGRLYDLLYQLFPFLRTHILAEIRKR
jgi:SAM-dependent methyltransferase